MGTEQVVIIGGWVLSLVALVATVAAVIRVASRRKRAESQTKRRQKAESSVSAWATYTIGMFATALFLVLSQKCAGMVVSDGEPVIIGSLLNTLAMFDLNRKIELNASSLSWLGAALPFYLVYNAALFLAAPVGVIGMIVSLLGEVFGAFRVRCHALLAKEVFVFSKLTPASLALAKSIPGKEKRGCLVVFANVKDRDADLASDARSEAGIFCVSQSIYILAEVTYSKKRPRNYILSSTDEARNLNDGIRLARGLAEGWEDGHEAPKVFIFSSSQVGESMVDAVAAEVNHEVEDDGKIKSFNVKVEIRRVNWVRNAVNALLDSRPLFTTGLKEGALKGEAESSAQKNTLEKDASSDAQKGASPDSYLAFDYHSDTRRILIVGDDEFAHEFFKGALWASQMGKDVETQIVVAATDKAAFESRLAFDAPELFARDARPYSGHFKFQIEEHNPESGDYLDFLLNCDGEDFTYVLIALENDLACAKVARRTREVLEQRRLQRHGSRPPYIAAVIQSDELAISMRDMKARDHCYAIEPVGCLSKAYSYENVFATTHYTCAKNLNRIYDIDKRKIDEATGDDAFRKAVQNADAKFMNSEYKQRSSLASALHRKYALFLVAQRINGKGDSVADDSLTIWTESLDNVCAKKPELLDAYYSTLEDADGMSWLAAIEHDRWSAYVVAEGYEQSGEMATRKFWPWSKSQLYDLARLHACLIDFSSLPELDKLAIELKRKYPDGKDPDAHKAFQEIDHVILRGARAVAAKDDDIFKHEWYKLFSSE